MRQETAHIYLDHPTPFRYSFYGTKKEKEQLFLQFVLSLIDGRRYSVYGKNAKEISQKEQEIRKKIEAGIYTDSRNITLDKYFDEWLEAKRGSIKGNTVKWYATYYKGHISPCLGNVKLQKMERRQVLAFQKELSEGDLSIRTCNNIRKILKIVLNDAVTDEIIIKNPAEGVKALKEVNAKAAETYHRALTEQEQKDFMQEMADDYYYEFVAFLLCTGMRFGEAAALTWSDIDYRQNVIHVTKTATFNEDNTRTTGTPKSEAGKRQADRGFYSSCFKGYFCDTVYRAGRHCDRLFPYPTNTPNSTPNLNNQHMDKDKI